VSGGVPEWEPWPEFDDEIILARGLHPQNPMRSVLVSAFAALTATGVVACAGSQHSDSPLARAQVSVKPELKAMDSEALHQLIRLSDNVYSGAAPEGAEAFAALRELGVRTLVCVDSAHPDVEGAAAYGLRYLHIPIGYDGVPEAKQMAIVAAMEEKDGPYYFHCHHGKHRGPAAAAIALRADSGCSADTARMVLEMAETSTGYPGLWRDVETWTAPPADAPRPAVGPIAEVSDFEGAMAAIDRTWDRMKLARAADWGAPEDHPDLVAANEAQALVEGLEASLRKPPQEYLTDAEFLRQLEESTRAARALRDGLGEGVAVSAEDLEARFEEVRSSCKSCHLDYRDV